MHLTDDPATEKGLIDFILCTCTLLGMEERLLYELPKEV